jgi:O-antigen biosynthesis protein
MLESVLTQRSEQVDKRGMRIRVRGKFLFAGEAKLYLRGVTYGTFHPDKTGAQFPPRQQVDEDFQQMAASGVNAVRVYTPPPFWLLDLAWQHGLYVMVGLPWEQHIAFLDQAGLQKAIEQRVRAAVRESSNHPAVLCYVVGNEIPAPIVRWHGRRRVERFIRRLYRAVKAEAPETLVTYVNYPTTEYLDLPFLDFFCFNVYLETPDKLDDYLAQLQNLAGDKPLVMAEIGLDSRRNSDAKQAETLDWQIRTIFAAGCAGMFVFAWTDEWYRGGYDIEDWDFGLTTRNREPKPALRAVANAFEGPPFPAGIQWPKFSVVVCTYNGARTLRNCLEGLKAMTYPNFEVIVVDDGSKDDTATIAAQYPFQLIQTENCGLGSARNTGLKAANGEIVAYIDDDARPDPHWLHYLGWTYLNTDYAAVGGPNIPPPEDGPIAECVANAPGGPVHVMFNHRDAEHIPGCNCSFRRDQLNAVGGFDPRYRAAGDDVDVCWRFLERGWKIGFHAGAMVWHHRRPSLRTYWKQQRGYGKAEALLEAKWPSKYNSFGHVTWAGRLYGKGLTKALGHWRVYHGFWGSAPFQRLYTARPHSLASLMLTPEWYLLNLMLAVLVVVSPSHGFLRYSAIPLLVSVFVPLLSVARSVSEAQFLHAKLRYRLLTGVLHIVQPLARLWGRFAHGLTPWKRRGVHEWAGLHSRVLRVWSEKWKAPEEWLTSVEGLLRSEDVSVQRGGDYDTWDIQTRGGFAGIVRLKLAIEEHGGGKQMLLFRLEPSVTRMAGVAVILMSLISVLAYIDHSVQLSAVFVMGAVLVLYRMITDCTVAAATVESALESLSEKSATANEALATVVHLGSS